MERIALSQEMVLLHTGGIVSLYGPESNCAESIFRKFAYNTPDETFAVVPDDFRMLAGDFNRDTYDPTQASHNAISFQCMGDGYDNEYNNHLLPPLTYLVISSDQMVL